MEKFIFVLMLLDVGCNGATAGFLRPHLDSVNLNKYNSQETIGFVPDDDCNGFCLNSGTCQFDENGMPYCICWPGFNGTKCEEQPCDRYDCFNGGNCQYLPYRPPDYAQCVCPEEWAGVHCEIRNTCKNKNITCSDHGQCINDDTNEMGYTCYCEAGRVGEDCEIDDTCYPNPCQHEGYCVIDQETDYKCYCTHGFHGDNCQIGDPCADYECQNGGHCEWQNEPSFLPRCQCEYDYEGPHCETKVECELECQNNGICAKDHNNESQCFCPPGWHGEACEKNACMTKQCLNGGTCEVEDGTGKPICYCIDGYSGNNCEENVCQGYEECIKDGHHGMCYVSSDGKPVCQCKSGWFGEFCDQEETTTTRIQNN